MLSGLFNFAQNLGILDRLKNKLLMQPDPAAKQLVDVLGELSKTYAAIDSELTKYLGIWFDDANMKDVVDQRKNLIGLEGGNVNVRMAEARGHCSKIRPIYERYLTPWFKKVLNRQEFKDMQILFNDLTLSDDAVIQTIDQLASWLEDRASLILDLIGQGRYQDANMEIENDRTQVLSQRRELSKIMRELYQLQAEFIKLSGAL